MSVQYTAIIELQIQSSVSIALSIIATSILEKKSLKNGQRFCARLQKYGRLCAVWWCNIDNEWTVFLNSRKDQLHCSIIISPEAPWWKDSAAVYINIYSVFSRKSEENVNKKQKEQESI